MAVTTEELERLSGQWLAEDKDGRVVAHARTLAELEQILMTEKGYKEGTLPAIRRVPEDGSTTFIL